LRALAVNTRIENFPTRLHDRRSRERLRMLDLAGAVFRSARLGRGTKTGKQKTEPWYFGGHQRSLAEAVPTLNVTTTEGCW
jgi:hypothetical protein